MTTTSEHGFTLVREEPIPEIDSTARLYRHDRTGAELLSILNRDENKVFGITFRTPPADSTGVAHILEHSVLCGSDKYPVKEPFVELLKGSLQTFLNAFTYPDKTCYPVASQHLKDFYNLIDIYMDAVLHPRLTRETHAQEAWHHEVDRASGSLSYKGVVFNEMKGVYASPDMMLAEYCQRVLFPHVTYGVDYGGDPAAIPDLTWDGLRAFHKRFYHPSNARIYFYGDDDPGERLRRMNAYLEGYDSQPVDSGIALQPPHPGPAVVEKHYPTGDGGEAGTFVAVNWLLGQPDNAEHLFALQVLSHILTGTPANPLRKALLDSGLGDDTIGVGLETQIQQPFYSTGLRGVPAGREAEVETLVLDTLRELAEQRIDRKTVEASLNTLEFSLREGNTGSYPRGLAMMIGTLQTWLYDGDPLLPLKFEAPLNAIRARIDKGEPYFERLLRRHLLDNPQRVRLDFKPDPDFTARRDAEEKKRLEAERAALSDADLERMAAAAEDLVRRQGEPDRPEDLAKLPTLTLKDLDPQNRLIPTERSVSDGVTWLVHPLDTHGIVYLDLGFNLGRLPDDLLPYVPIWSQAILEAGTEHEDYVALLQRVGRATGGLDAETYATTRMAQDREGMAWMFFRGKALVGQAGELVSIFRDIFTTTRFDLQDRIRQIVLEEKAGLESDIVPSGHRMAGMRAKAALSAADRAYERMNGLSYFRFVRELAGRLKSDWKAVETTLRSLSETLFARHGMVVNLTAADEDRVRLEREVAKLVFTLPAGTEVPAVLTPPDPRPDASEAWVIPAQVQYVSHSLPLRSDKKRIDGSALVATRYLRSAWLWDQVRVQGGAYGGFCGLDYRSGLFSFGSYRDPNLDRTLDIYRKTAAYLKDLDLSEAELTKAVIGAIGDFDGYLFPDAKGYLAMTRHLAGDTDDHRQKLREEVLATKPNDFRAFGEALEAAFDQGFTAALGSEQAFRCSARTWTLDHAM